MAGKVKVLLEKCDTKNINKIVKKIGEIIQYLFYAFQSVLLIMALSAYAVINECESLLREILMRNV